MPGAANPNGYAVLDPNDPAGYPTAFRTEPDECDHIHLHGTFQGHPDPDPACGHGGLVYIISP